jgi:hypothetical protein
LTAILAFELLRVILPKFRYLYPPITGFAKFDFAKFRYAAFGVVNVELLESASVHTVLNAVAST